MFQGQGVGDLNSLGFQLIGLTTDSNYGSKTDNIKVATGTEDLLPPITIERTGTISGKFILEGGADPTGIDVYIPGTSSIAKTDASGNFVISKVPTGTYIYLRAEKTGYLPKYWTNIKVLPDMTTAFDQAVLSVSTGVAGAVSIAGGAEFSRNRTVDIDITYSPDALLMQVSEDPTFVGAQWKFVQDKITHTFNSDGKKTIYVNFADSNGLETKVSDSIIIVVDFQPSALSPNGITGGTRPTFSWSPSLLPTETYDFQLATDPGFTKVIEDHSNISMTSIKIDSILSNYSSYYWHVRSIDSQGLSGAWNSANFSVDLSIPQPISPVYDTVIVQSKPTLVWESQTTDVRFIVQISETSDFSTILETKNGITSKNHIPGITLKTDTTYYWRVAVESEGGVYGGWGGPSMFHVVLPAIATTTPSPGAVVAERRPLFTWQSAERAKSYRIQIALNEDFSLISVDKSGLFTNSYKPADPGLKGNTTYFWRVSYLDNNNSQSTWSETKEISIEPYTISLIQPSGSIQFSQPTFFWNASYLSNQTYIFQLSNDNRFENIFLEKNGISDTSYRITSSVINRITYYWRVKAVASDGDEGQWSSPSTINLEYYGTTLSSPWNGETIYTATPAFRWNQVSWASKYRILIGKSNVFTDTVVDEIVNNNEYQTNSILPDNCTLYWKVQPLDEYGAGGDWSEIRSITLPPHTLNMWINITLPSNSVSARFVGDGTYYTQVGGSIDIRVDNYWDFTSFEWALDGVPVKDANGNKVIGYSCFISNLAKGRYTLSMVAVRNGVPYDTQATVIVQ